MDASLKTHIENIHSADSQVKNDAYYALMAATEQPVDWAYEVWDGLVKDFKHADNHVRSIAAQLIANLAKSDPDRRILKDFDALLDITYDERFVTARHALQSLWKVGAAGDAQRKIYLEGIERRFNDCITEKNWTLIRSDIIQSLKDTYAAAPDDSIRDTALALIDSETDDKYKKKYMAVWKKK